MDGCGEFSRTPVSVVAQFEIETLHDQVDITACLVGAQFPKKGVDDFIIQLGFQTIVQDYRKGLEGVREDGLLGEAYTGDIVPAVTG